MRIYYKYKSKHVVLSVLYYRITELQNYKMKQDSITSPGNLFQHLITLTVKMCSLVFRWKLTCAYWLLSCHQALQKTDSLVLIPLYQVLMFIDQTPSGLFFFMLKNPSLLSLCTYKGCSSHLIFMTFLWIHHSMSMSFWYWGTQNWTQHSKHQCWVEGSTPLTYWQCLLMQPLMVLILCISWLMVILSTSASKAFFAKLPMLLWKTVFHL